MSADFVYISASSQNGDFFPKTWRELPFSKWKYSFLHRFYEKYLLQTLISDEIRIQKCITMGAVEKSRHPNVQSSWKRRIEWLSTLIKPRQKFCSHVDLLMIHSILPKSNLCYPWPQAPQGVLYPTLLESAIFFHLTFYCVEKLAKSD